MKVIKLDAFDQIRIFLCLVNVNVNEQHVGYLQINSAMFFIDQNDNHNNSQSKILSILIRDFLKVSKVLINNVHKFQNIKTIF